jgi:hypothetical protein
MIRVRISKNGLAIPLFRKKISPIWVAINNLSIESPGSIADFITVGKFILLTMGCKRTLTFIT